MKVLKRKPGLALLACCYAGGLVLFLLWCLFGFAQNRIRYANGELVPMEFTMDRIDQFNFVDIEERDGRLVTTGRDPQLIYCSRVVLVENVVLELEYSKEPLLVNVFWKSDYDKEYSLREMAYSLGGDNRLFLLPGAGAGALRIDPGTVAGNEITVKRIAFNQKRPFWMFFIPTAGQVVLLCFVPGMVACAVAICGQAGLWAQLGKWLRGLRPHRKAGDAE